MTLPSRIVKWLRAFRSLGWMRAELGDHAAELSRHRATFAAITASLDAITASLDAITASLDANTASLARVDAVLPTLAMRADAEAAQAAARAEIEQLGIELRRVDETHHAFARRIDPPLPPLIRAGSGDASVWLYAAFEETFRGTRDEIAARLSVYLSDVARGGAGHGTAGRSSTSAADAASGSSGCAMTRLDCPWRRHQSRNGCRLPGARLDVRARRRRRPAGRSGAAGSVAAVTVFHVVEHLPLARSCG